MSAVDPQLPDLDDTDWDSITPVPRLWVQRFVFPGWDGPTTEDIDHLLGPEYRMAMEGL